MQQTLGHGNFHPVARPEKNVNLFTGGFGGPGLDCSLDLFSLVWLFGSLWAVLASGVSLNSSPSSGASWMQLFIDARN